MRLFRRKNRKQSKLSNQTKSQKKISSFQSLEEIKQEFKQYFGDQDGIIYRNVILPHTDQKKCLLIFISEITNQDYIAKQIIQPIKSINKQDNSSFITYMKDTVLTTGNISISSDFTMLFDDLLMGKALLFIESEQEALSIAVDEWKGRQVTEPTSQTVVRGPRESFTEDLNTNKALIRKRMQSNQLRIKTMHLGEYTKTEISILYIHGVSDPDVVQEVENRMKKIKIDGVIGSNNIEELIQDEKASPFPTIDNTERADIATAALLEGRVVIIVNGTPFTLIVPVVFIQFFQTAEDYYSRAIIGSATRLLRYFSFFITLLAPSTYIALTTFHQEMIPTQLLSSIAAQREGVPFPALVEALIMEITFEILREAGIRMPKMVGQAVSVVGAIVIGQASVEAGFVSAAMVIVVAITAIASFVLPSYNMANSIRLLRFPMMFLGGSFGFFGIMLGLFIIVIHLCSLKSFGISYMAPLSPFHMRDQRDTFIRTIKTSNTSSKGVIFDKSKK